MFMAMARAASTRATCYRLNVGAVLVDVAARNVVAVGYNGAPSGQPHCTGNGCQYFTSAGCRVVHAEVNALRRLQAERDATSDPGLSFALYVTHSPCRGCAEGLLKDGRIRVVYFEVPYRDPAPVQFLLNGSPRVEVFQLLPSGLAVDQSTNQLVELQCDR